MEKVEKRNWLEEKEVKTKMKKWLVKSNFRNIRPEKEVFSNTLVGKRQVDIYAEKGDLIYYIECKGDSERRKHSIKQNIDLLLGKIISLLGSNENFEIWGVVPKHWINQIPFNIGYIKWEFNSEKQKFRLFLMDIDGELEEFNFQRHIFLLNPGIAFEFRNKRTRELLDFHLKKTIFDVRFTAYLVTEIQEFINQVPSHPIEEITEFLNLTGKEIDELSERFKTGREIIIEVVNQMKEHFFSNGNSIRVFLEFLISEGIITTSSPFVL